MATAARRRSAARHAGAAARRGCVRARPRALACSTTRKRVLRPSLPAAPVLPPKSAPGARLGVPKANRGCTKSANRSRAPRPLQPHLCASLGAMAPSGAPAASPARAGWSLRSAGRLPALSSLPSLPRRPAASRAAVRVRAAGDSPLRRRPGHSGADEASPAPGASSRFELPFAAMSRRAVAALSLAGGLLPRPARADVRPPAPVRPQAAARAAQPAALNAAPDAAPSRLRVLTAPRAARRAPRAR